VSPFAAEALAEGLRALTRDPVCGNGVTDLDASEALDALVADGWLGSAVRTGVRSEEGPRDVVIRADLASGVEGFARVLEGMLRAVR
jgi:hypothetical protein